jgi:Flp pilus assembly protein TadG
MAAHQRSTSSRPRVPEPSGQSAMEFALITPLMLVLMLTIIDFGRAIHFMQVMANLSRQGSNLASRGTTLPASAAAVISGDAPLNLTNNGEVIVTSVANIGAAYIITGQASQGGVRGTSKVGTGVGSRASIPSSAAAMLAPGQTIFVTEIFYSFKPVTPIANLLRLVMPSSLYEAAYF